MQAADVAGSMVGIGWQAWDWPYSVMTSSSTESAPSCAPIAHG